MSKPVLDADALSKPCGAVEKAIAEVRSFSAPAGSREMRSASAALEYLGYAYSLLRPASEANPAWADKGG